MQDNGPQQGASTWLCPLLFSNVGQAQAQGPEVDVKSYQARVLILSY